MAGALVLSIGGLVLCCAPVGIIGAFLGFRGIRQAKAVGVGAPATGYLSIVAGVLSVLLTGGVTTAYILDTQKQADRLSQLRKDFREKRQAATLDQETACAAAEINLLSKGYDGSQLYSEKVTCNGPLTMMGTSNASLANVKTQFGGKEVTLTACLTKRARWFVVQHLDGECVDTSGVTLPAMPTGVLSEEQVQGDEDAVRKALDEAKTKVVVDQLVSKLAKVKDATQSVDDLKQAKCDDSAFGDRLPKDGRLQVFTVDYNVLAGDEKTLAQKEWRWLTTSSIRRAMDPKQDSDKRAAAAEEFQSKSKEFVVVYRSVLREWFQVEANKSFFDEDFSYKGAGFIGWLIVADAKTGERLCQNMLKFESSDSIRYRKGRFESEDVSAAQAVEADVEDNFKDAATKSLAEIAPKLKLGYKILE